MTTEYQALDETYQALLAFNTAYNRVLDSIARIPNKATRSAVLDELRDVNNAWTKAAIVVQMKKEEIWSES